jgi:hypothetical protein
MAFSYTKTGEDVHGSVRVVSGTFTNTGGSVGGNIYTGLEQVYGLRLQQKSSAVVATQGVVNATFPKNDPVAMVTEAVNNVCGYWEAFGI